MMALVRVARWRRSPCTLSRPAPSATPSRSGSSFFSGKLDRSGGGGNASASDEKPLVLSVSAAHSDSSLVASAAFTLLSELRFDHKLLQRNLWRDELVSYDASHVAAKFRLLKGRGSDEDEALFRPILEVSMLCLCTRLTNDD